MSHRWEVKAERRHCRNVGSAMCTDKCVQRRAPELDRMRLDVQHSARFRLTSRNLLCDITSSTVSGNGEGVEGTGRTYEVVVAKQSRRGGGKKWNIWVGAAGEYTPVPNADSARARAPHCARIG